MARRNRTHIIVQQEVDPEKYRRPRRAIESDPLPAPSNRIEHGEQLSSELRQVEESARQRREELEAVISGAQPGVYVTFQSFPGIDLALPSLESRRGKTHVELRSVQTRTIDGAVTEFATVFVPDGKMKIFLNSVQKYLETASAEAPKNKNLFDRIKSISIASLQSFWSEPTKEFPEGDTVVWWELWLRRRDGEEISRVEEFAELYGVTLSKRRLVFPDRIVILLKASANQLTSSIDLLDDLSELRFPQQISNFLASEPSAVQNEWVEDLAKRVVAADKSAAATCVLDTGVHNNHPLLKSSLDDEDCHACDPSWGSDDNETHGTEMAGLALYGDLDSAIGGNERITLRHRLESVKILPPPPAINEPDIYGALTSSAVSLVEIQNARRRRTFSLAVTADDQATSDPDVGRAATGQPTSWSAAVDALAAGLSIDVSDDGLVFLSEVEESAKRLFVISTGNIRRDYEQDHLARSDIESLEDPAQAWNALTIGAYTALDQIENSSGDWDGWDALAETGELSPFSRTSVLFKKAWPLKPDVVLEGGNLATDGSKFDTPRSLQLLTTKPPLHDGRLLTTTHATSAATAQAAHLTAVISNEYPSLWPETVRGLVVHSARWTVAMEDQFRSATTRRSTTNLVRRYGMGVPDLARATRSATDALTLIVQDSLQPFSLTGAMGEMKIHDLPWPHDELLGLGGANVKLRVTLSYFIEPNPGRRGWGGRYAYASHALRFDLRRALESDDAWRKRINEDALQSGEKRSPSEADVGHWSIGPEERTVGSLHHDIWTGTAAELAARGAIAVVPVTGWWKFQKEALLRSPKARYSLVISIETPDEDVDIWTPVAQQVGIPTDVEIEI